MSKNWVLAALLVAATPAAAHDWYPIECCHGMDCAPVEKVEMLQPPGITGLLGSPAYASVPEARLRHDVPGSMMVTTKLGSVVVPADFPRRESKDNRMHACMRPADGGGMRLICIFMPPST
ncbi:MAG: hypothetical protein F9K29_10570 [Hyphomicrobiaceae bacterium]|nr:MAG: hypothetical protein F9K29_10570 [Hyphomicrobiaceae bacterium]